jgi:DNA-binding IscR family transcriptional regulator
MLSVAQSFQSGARVSLKSLAQTLEVPSSALQPIIEALESAELLDTTTREQLVLGRDPNSIHLDEIVLAIRDAGAGRAITLTDAQTPQVVQNAARTIDAAIHAALGQVTLAELARQAPA